jgi:hypothetical protein
MSEHRPTNSELRLQQLEEAEREAAANKGILEIFERPEDEPLAREKRQPDD